MRTSETHTLGILSIIAIGFLHIAPVALAQNNILAIGQVNSNGTLAASANTLGAAGAVNSAQNGTGDYTITLTSPGFFAGNVEQEFLVEVTVESSISNDEVPKATIDTVNANQLTIDVHIDDVEDPSNNNLAEPRSASFFFAIYRIPAAFPDPGATKYLHALGKVDANGSLLSGLGVNGIAVSSSRTAEGDYNLTLTKPGAFPVDAPDDYVVILSVEDSSAQDQVIRGDVTSTFSDDQVVINVHTDDVQINTNDDTVAPADTEFFFNIYRIPAGAGTGLADSQLLVAMASVNGSNGNLFTAGKSFDGGILVSVRNGEGDYRIIITSPGAFAGKTANQYVLQLHLNQGVTADEFINGIVSLPDANTMHVDVQTQDLETAGQAQGVANDSNFYLLVYDTEARFQPDLRIGSKKNLTQQVGDDIYNAGGAFQQATVGLKSTTKKKYWFSLENDGNLIDDIFLKGKRSGSKIKSKYFRITGGRQNVTAAITGAGLVVDDVPPTKLIRYEAQAKYKNPAKRPSKTLRFLARSQFMASQLDANKARLVPK